VPELSFNVNIVMSLHTLESAYHPRDKMGFLIDWLVTLKCNYDCDYCEISEYGHDNSQPHPSFERAMMMLEQMFQYVDVIMHHKKRAFKDVIMNIYGGESIYHPDIIRLIEATSDRYSDYRDKWRIRRRITTNGTATEKNWAKICEHIEGFTMSYHSTGPDKMKKLFKNNLLYLQEIQKEHDVIVCMYSKDPYWQDCMDFLHWAKSKDIRVRPKLLDGPLGIYDEHHIKDLGKFVDPKEFENWNTKGRSNTQSRACCGGRKMCFNRNLKEYQTMVPRGRNGFKGWHCSANQFFLHGNTITGHYFTNKDCRVKIGGGIGPVATIDTMPDYIKQMSSHKTLPMMKCEQKVCSCGTCAPKSKHIENLNEIMRIYNTAT